MRVWIASVWIGVAAMLLPGCGPSYKRHPVPEELKYAAHVPNLQYKRITGAERALVGAKAREKEFIEQVHSSDAYDGPLSILTISGGGANGAFGAGLLCGWTLAGDRPEFQYVTGISTGALIAPFAFLGPDYDDDLEKFYTTTSTKDLMKKRGFLGAIMNDAMATDEGLRKYIKEAVDDQMIEEIAVQHRRGRRLWVATSNLDLMEPVYWNIGAIAASGAPNAHDVIHNVLLASASIPGVFPPVFIQVVADGKQYDEMHVDDGATAQVFAYPGKLNVDEILEGAGIAPDHIQLYIIRNSKLQPTYEQVEPKLFKIIERSVSSMIRTQGIGDLYQIYLLCTRDHLGFHLAYIGEQFTAVTKEPFDPVYMTALFNFGKDLARSGYPWQIEPPAYDAN